MSEPTDRISRLTGMRRMIATKMQRSLRETAQLSYHAEAEASELVRARTAWRQTGARVSYEDLLIAVIVRALRKHPTLNAVADGDQAKIMDAIHVSVAIALPNGLVAPALFDAHALTVPQIAAARQDLIARARAGKLTVREMTGGTFGVSNLGASRVRFFTPILNYPQIAIVGVGQLAQRPWVADDGSVVARPVIALSLTTDHRFIDGEPSAAFLTTLCRLIEGVGEGVPQP